MSNETRTCQNCAQSFTIEPKDFEFYRMMQVPPPTFCPLCRYQRRLMFRNERTLYSRTCDLCAKQIISTFRADAWVPVYCNACWWTGAWDAGTFGRDYDPSRTFFEQFAELMRDVPFPQLTQDYQTMINSDYTNYIGHTKNCYLTFDCDSSENILYSKTVIFSKDCMDCFGVGNCNLCHEIVTSGNCSRLFYSEDCTDCLDVYFSRTCSGLQNCFGCINLRNKKYCWFNEQLSKEEYEARLAAYRLDTHTGVLRARQEADAFFLNYPHKFIHGNRNIDSTGEYIFSSKNAHDMYIAQGCENTRYCQSISMPPVKDAYDYSEWGNNASRIYECATVGEGADNVRFSWSSWRQGSMNLEYCMFTLSSQNMFGCVGMKKKQYCILNKEYSKEEFDTLRTQIIQDMAERPYIDALGRTWRYGEFFPYDLSLSDYNESTAIQYFPLSRDEAMSRGFRWYEGDRNQHSITKRSDDLPDSIHDVTEDILNEIISCGNCTKAYRIVQAELDLLRSFSLPLPRTCPDCRHLGRITRSGKPFFHERTCTCSGAHSSNNAYTNGVAHPHHTSNPCGVVFQTPYAPDRSEIVYCEQCFQAEVA